LVTGDYLFTIDASGAWATQSLFKRSSGLRTSFFDWRDSARALVFAPGLSTVFMLNSGVSPSDINMIPIDQTTGTLGAETDSPYHGDYSLLMPIRLLPDESAVILGSGLLFSTANLLQTGATGFNHVDVAFIDTRFFLLTEDSIPSTSVIRTLDADFAVTTEERLSGSPRNLFNNGGQLLVLSYNESFASIQIQTVDVTGW
jgi:hypothetical protein